MFVLLNKQNSKKRPENKLISHESEVRIRNTLSVDVLTPQELFILSACLPACIVFS